ncbi:MAG: hypothetical protein KIT84_00155 [Labilithrix sp.]|nr:hypothetical protein [Labilithrix sp.]MCW5809394.1 hypothetical protein [Labilithrix sp.]
MSREEIIANEACPAEYRVSSYLEGLEEGARDARRRWLVTYLAGAGFVAVGFLTSIGVLPTDAAGLAAGAGAAAVGVAMAR